VYHQVAGAGDMLISDNDSAREHMEASEDYRADLDTQVDRFSESVGY